MQNRASLIKPLWEDELYKYMTGIVQKNGHKLLRINGIPDHIHLLFGMRPIQSLSDLMQDIKGSSYKWINEKKFIRGKFTWQEGYGAFAYAKSDLSNVLRYIDNQKQHHSKMRFIDEYVLLLDEFEIDFDEKYIFRGV
mgnify:CR=1 FL=1